MRRLWVLFAVLLGSLPAAAQFTQVSGTVIDPNGIPYANGTIAPILVNTSGQSVTLNGAPYSPPIQPAGLDKNGNFSLNLADNTVLSPAGTKWNFWVCSAIGTIPPSGGTGSQCFTLSSPLTISGSSQNISTQLQAAALALSSGGGGSPTFDKIKSGTNTTAAMVVGSGSSLSPLNIGQLVGTQTWLLPGYSAPSITGTLTGGSILNGSQWLIQYTLNTAAGETLPSVEVSGSTNTLSGGVCNAGSACTLTVVAPTIPSGFTTYNVYACNTTAGPCTVPQKVAACTAITINCTFTTAYGTNTSGVPVVSTAFIQPPNAQAFNGMFGEVPSIWASQSDGTFEPWLVLDWSTCGVNFTPCGTPTFIRRTFFTDMGNGFNTSPVSYGAVINQQSYSNSFVSINHLQGIQNDNNQDRALSIFASDPIGFAGSIHALEGLQIEQDVNCNGCAINGIPDGEVTPLSLQMQNNASTTYGTSYGTNGIRIQYFRAGAGLDTGGNNIINGIWTDNTSTAPLGGGAVVGIYKAKCQNSVGGTRSITCFGLNVQADGSNPFGGGQIAVFSQNIGTLTPSETRGDFLIRNDIHAYTSVLNGMVGNLGNYNSDAGTSYPFSASETLTGSQAIVQIPNSVGATASCTGGGSTYTYELVANDGNGGTGIIGTTNTLATCTNPLTAGNPATISIPSVGAASWWTAIKGPLGAASSVDVYRCGGPMGFGKVGTLALAQDTGTFGLTAFSDTGIAATGVCPTFNSTGQFSSAGYFSAQMNHKQLTSDFTSAANTSLQTITGLSWNLDGTAKNYSFHCSLMYSQGTAAASMQFGIQVATANPTNVNAKGRVDTSTSAQTSGVLTGLATTTATSIVTFTPSASATVFGADLDGSIELPANLGAGNVVNIMVQTSNASDLPTVKRGSYCYLY